MAQTVFESLLIKHGLRESYITDSAGLHDYHEGEKADSRMRMHAERHGYTITHRSRPVIQNDFEKFDLIVGMDNQNIRELRRLSKTDAHRAKIVRMTDFLQQLTADSVPDPYYGGAEGFEQVILLLKDACQGLLHQLLLDEKKN